MALANFFGKSALGASQVLKNFNLEGFQQILLSHRICIYFSKKSITTTEGFACADMLVRLLVRLYPNLQVKCTDGRSQEKEYLQDLALSINPSIDLSESYPTISIVIGDVNIKRTCQTFFVGCDQWLAKFSQEKPQLTGSSFNRFGAGASACFAAANVFRHVFSAQLPSSELDQDFVYSSFNGCINEQAEQGPPIKEVKLEDTVLVGLGAIGNGAVWGLKDFILTGSLHAIDGQTIAESNLQRYVLTTQDDIGEEKTKVVTNFLNNKIVQPYPAHFEDYIVERGNWDILRVAVCVDSAKDRLMVQGSLPKRVINAWTQQEQCGISRHYNFLDDPCVACLYPARPEEKSLPLKIAESLSLTHPAHILMIREYMAIGKPVDAVLIDIIASAKQIQSSDLFQYIGQDLESFYGNVICGGVLMTLTGGEQKQAAEVPSAFESAMAGIMLAAELVIDCGQLRKPKYTIHKLNLLSPITKYLHDPVAKLNGCICNDQIYKDRYSEKWKLNIKRVSNSNKEPIETITMDKNLIPIK